MRSLTTKIIHRMADLKPESKHISRMAEKIDLMNKTMNETSPRIFSLFMMATTIPTFWFGYKVITEDYNSQQFTQNTQKTLNYINIKNIMTYSCMFALTKLKYISPTAKFTLPNRGLFGKTVPLLLSIIALLLPPSDSKYIVFPTFAADVGTLIFEAQMTNYGVYPFWMYSFRHYARFFDWIVLGITFFALHNYRKRIQSHPYQFIKEVQDPIQ